MALNRYSPTIQFQDPITKADTLDAYVANIGLLRSAFNIDFVLHAIDITSSNVITAR